MSTPLPPLGGAPATPELGAPGRSQRGVIAAIACIALFGISAGMMHPLFGLKLEQAGWSSGMIGLNGAMVAVAALTLGPLMPRLVRLLGLPGFLTAGALLSSASMLMFPLFESYGAWLVLRYLQGAAATALFLGSETWIVADAEEGARGRVVGLYATVLSLGFAAGPMILNAVGFEGWTPFIACAALGLICVIPLATAWGDAPKAAPDDVSDIAPLRFLVTDPTVLFAVVLFGAIEFGVMALLPVWGVKTGLEREAASFLISVLVLGNVVFQIPLGALADRWNRRGMLIFCAAVTVAMAAALPWLAGSVWPLWAGLFIWGGLVAGLYTIALIELGARYTGARLVSATAAVVSAYGIGALVGPILTGAAMDAVEPDGLSLALGAMALAYLALALLRARRAS